MKTFLFQGIDGQVVGATTFTLKIESILPMTDLRGGEEKHYVKMIFPYNMFLTDAFPTMEEARDAMDEIFDALPCDASVFGLSNGKVEVHEPAKEGV